MGDFHPGLVLCRKCHYGCLGDHAGMARIGVRGERTAWECWESSGAVLIERDV